MKKRYLLIFQSMQNVFCSLVLVAFMVMAICPKCLTSYDPNAIDMENRLQPMTAQHILGTDDVGRDLWSRVVHGAAASLVLMLCVLAVSVPCGVVLGVLAGLSPGLVQVGIMRLTDIWVSLPRLVFAMMLPGLLGVNGWVVSVLAIGVTSWPVYTRLACVETERVSQLMYVHIARLQGASSFYIMRKHILPMVIPSVVIRMSLDGSSILLISAALAFLGLGISPTVIEWGSMASQGSAFLLGSPLVAVIPACAIALCSYALNILGDVIRDVLDPAQEI